MLRVARAYTLLLGGNENAIQVVDIQTKIQVLWRMGNDQHSLSLGLSPAGDLVVVGGSNSQVDVFSIEKVESLRFDRGQTDNILAKKPEVGDSLEIESVKQF